jgi:hypothetical protein
MAQTALGAAHAAGAAYADVWLTATTSRLFHIMYVVMKLSPPATDTNRS